MKKILIVIIILTGLFYSCSKESYTILPKGQASASTLENKVGVNALLIGVYACADGTNNSNAGQAWASTVSNWVWGSIAGGDAYKGSSINDQSDIVPIEDFYVDASNSYVESHWTTFYDAIRRANDVLTIMKSANDMTTAEKTEVEAEDRFLRAHFYFELTIVHGKVPYIDENTVNPSSVPNDHLVYPEMEADLTFAMKNLPSRQTDLGRVTKWAAETYLAKVYMFEQKFSDAMLLLRDVYTNGGFTLMPSYEQNYRIKNNNNAESIWELEYATNDGFSGSPNANWGDGLAKPVYGAGLPGTGNFYSGSHDLVSSFRTTSDGLPYFTTYSATDIVPWSMDGLSVPYKLPVDPRLDWTVGRPGVPFLDYGVIQPGVPIANWIFSYANYGPYPLFVKTYFLKSEGNLATTTGWMTGVNPNNLRVFRLANVILWLAECEAQVGSLHNATMLVNEIRNRAKNSNVVRFNDGTPAANYLVEPYPADFPSKDYALQAIYREDRLEFGMEGMRFFDLVRWGIAADKINNFFQVDGSIMPPLVGKTFTKGKNEIWPIPQHEIDLSQVNGKSVLTQNPGY